MKVFFSDLKQFFYNLATDPKIPKKDLLINKIILILIISPLDFIPDWIAGYGLIDDFLLICLFSDYWTNVIDQDLILTHYPWTMKSFTFWQKIMKFLSNFSPNFISDHLWQYKKSPY